MIVHWNMCQGTSEWFEKKWGRVGGSTSKGYLVNSDTLLLHILSEHLEPYEDSDDDYASYDMQRGIELEPLARQKIGEYAKVKFLECGLIEGDNLMVVSPDGLTKDMKIACEIKSPAKKKHAEILMSKTILSDYINQCIHYFSVNDHLEKLYFGSFRPECKHELAIRELTRDTIVDLGTKAKPNCKKVSEWVEIIKFKAKELEDNVNLSIEQLSF